MNIASYITAYNRINLRQSIDLYWKEKIKFQEETKRYLYDFRVGADFLNKLHETFNIKINLINWINKMMTVNLSKDINHYENEVKPCTAGGSIKWYK